MSPVKAPPDVPEDFPRGTTAATVPGAQLKLSARRINGRFVVGLTPEELYERWDICEDLARQLAARTRRQQEDGHITDINAFYQDTERRVRAQPWGLSSAEVDWLMKRTRELVS